LSQFSGAHTGRGDTPISSLPQQQTFAVLERTLRSKGETPRAAISEEALEITTNQSEFVFLVNGKLIDKLLVEDGPSNSGAG